MAASCSRRNVTRLAAARAVETVLARQAFDGALVRKSYKLPRGLADRFPELVRPPHALALPERHRPGDSGRGGHEHAVARDLLDPPARRSEQDHLPGTRLVHHLLVQLAHAAAPVHQVHAEEAAVGDRPRVLHGEPLSALTRTHEPGGAVPDHTRAQLGELVRGIATGQHVEDVLELDARQVGKRVRASHQLVELVHCDLLLGADRDDLLREDVERVARDGRLLDRPFEHPLRDHRALEQVGAELREEAALGHGAQLVARTADALQAAGDRLRRLDLDDEVNGAHVDAELERRRRDQARDLPRLEQLLDLGALLARQRSVVRAGNLLLRELVQPEREPLRETPVVDEHDGRAVLAHEPEQLGVDGRPDGLRRAVLAAAPGLPHVLDRDDDLEVELLRAACIHKLDRAAPRHEAADLLERALGRGQADPLQRPLDEAFQPLDREREVRPALRPRDRVHLVQDQRLDPAEVLAGARGQQEIERFGSRDEDVRGLAQHRRPLFLRGVPRAYPYVE